MLQWMGGSRRKVTTSRKSTQQRQKQYFEQRRRRQQHQGETTGLESYADGINISGPHQKEHRSLDILSLLNLSTIAQQHKSASPNRREDLEVNTTRAKYDITKDPPTIPSKMVAPPSSFEFNKARAESGGQVETASPKKVTLSAPDKHNKSFTEVDSEPDNRRIRTEQEFSVLDLFGDVGLTDYVEGSPVHESHVAFSVEGLGKMGMETPVHTPKQPGRTFSYDCASPLKAPREPKSFKYRKPLDDFEFEMDAMMQDIGVPLYSSALEFSTDSMDSFNNSKPKLSRHDGRSGKLDSYYGCGRTFDNSDNCSKDKWDGRPCFPDENSFNEWEHDLSWKNWSSPMKCGSIDNLMHEKYKMSDFAFEGPFSPMRCATDITDKLDILEAPSYSKHQTSENDHDFLVSNGARQYHTVGRSFDFGGVTSQPDWSCFTTENERDNLSMLSEESCSSSAVRVNAIDKSLPKATRNRSKRRLDNAYVSPEYHVNITSTGKTQDKNRHVVQPESIGHGSGKCTRMSNSSKLKPSHYSNSPFQEKLTPNSNWFAEERYVAVDTNSGCSCFHQKSETNFPSAGSKLLLGDPFSTRPVPELHHDARSPFKHCEPAATSPSDSFITEKLEIHDSPMTSQIAVGSTTPEFIYSPGKTLSLDLSAQESVSKDDGRKSISQLCEKSNPEEQNCILNNSWFTEYNDGIGPLTSKNKSSECKEANDATSGLKESAGKTSSSLKIPDKRETIDEKEDHHGYEIPLPCQIWYKDAQPQERKKESTQQSDFVDSSCQVMMLQSYVQFLCVQKVLKEAAAQNGLKKM